MFHDYGNHVQNTKHVHLSIPECSAYRLPCVKSSRGSSELACGDNVRSSSKWLSVVKGSSSTVWSRSGALRLSLSQSRWPTGTRDSLGSMLFVHSSALPWNNRPPSSLWHKDSFRSFRGDPEDGLMQSNSEMEHAFGWWRMKFESSARLGSSSNAVVRSRELHLSSKEPVSEVRSLWQPESPWHAVKFSSDSLKALSWKWGLWISELWLKTLRWIVACSWLLHPSFCWLFILSATEDKKSCWATHRSCFFLWDEGLLDDTWERFPEALTAEISLDSSCWLAGFTVWASFETSCLFEGMTLRTKCFLPSTILNPTTFVVQSGGTDILFFSMSPLSLSFPASRGPGCGAVHRFVLACDGWGVVGARETNSCSPLRDAGQFLPLQTLLSRNFCVSSKVFSGSSKMPWSSSRPGVENGSNGDVQWGSGFGSKILNSWDRLLSCFTVCPLSPPISSAPSLTACSSHVL